MAKSVKMQKRENNVKRIFKDFCKIFPVFTMCCAGGVVCADQAPNPRSAVSVNSGAAVGRTSASPVRGSGENQNVVSGRARSAVKRNAVSRSVQGTKSRVARNETNARVMVPRGGASNVSRSAVSVARGALTGAAAARSAVKVADGVSRAAARARATAVFSDVSKIGAGYMECRDAYATCMDQFCANANDTYRRCYCSSRYTELRDREQSLDEATAMLQRFESESLSAVDKTAAEVEAMYSATVGEMAVKSDTSAAGRLLGEIDDLLVGGKSSGVDNLFDVGGDIWSLASEQDSIFDTKTGVDLTALEGQSLYNSTNAQCVKAVAEACSEPAVLTMATSAYNIMITQDCNVYEKKVNAKDEKLKTAVRTAEKALRDARLEEYRAHNSQDFNDCLSKVRDAMLTDGACGVNFSRCLDGGTGAYINQLTGEAIFTPRLFQLTNLITLKGVDSASWTREDVLRQNKQFDEFLDSKKQHAERALDTCRDLADDVWVEFKRNALIEIAQAQDEKIEEVKMSCVNTMAECYDSQENALKSFDKSTSKVAGALSVYTAREMCKDKVSACASLYGGTEKCEFDSNGRLVAGSNGDRCGLTALLSFVDTVDMTRVAENCQDAIKNYVTDLCTPKNGDQVYPWNCRSYEFTTALDGFKRGDSTTNNLGKILATFAMDNCFDPTISAEERNSFSNLPTQTKTAVEQAIVGVRDDLSYMLEQTCVDLNGYWAHADSASLSVANNANEKELLAFYSKVYGGSDKGDDFGKCFENTTRTRCLAYNTDSAKEDSDVEPYAKYNAELNICEFSMEWYKNQCAMLGEGFFENGVCYVKRDFNATEE